MKPADRVAQAIGDTLAHVASGVAHGWVKSHKGTVATFTGSRDPMLNTVIGVARSPLVDSVAELLDELLATGYPSSLQLRPGCEAGLVELAAVRKMVPSEDSPTLTCEAHQFQPEALEAEGLHLRKLDPTEAGVHLTAIAAGFEETEEWLSKVVTPDVLGLDGIAAYIGEIDGEVAVTGMGITVGASVGVFNVATLPRHRGRGYARALTARLTREGFDGGASFAWLQASPAGAWIFEQLGFRVVETWKCWVSGEADGDSRVQPGSVSSGP